MKCLACSRRILVLSIGGYVVYDSPCGSLCVSVTWFALFIFFSLQDYITGVSVFYLILVLNIKPYPFFLFTLALQLVNLCVPERKFFLR